MVEGSPERGSAAAQMTAPPQRGDPVLAAAAERAAAQTADAAVQARLVRTVTRDLLRERPDQLAGALRRHAAVLGRGLGADLVTVCGTGALDVVECVTWCADGRRDGWVGTDTDAAGLVGAVARRVLRDDLSVWLIPDLAAESVVEPTLAGLAARGLQTALAVPLWADGSPAGVVVLGSRSRHPWTGRVADRLRMLADAIEALADRRRVEAEAATRNRRYEEILDGQTEMICRFTPDLRVTYANMAYASQYDHTPESIVGHSLLEFFPPEAHDWARNEVAQLGLDTPIRSHENEVVLGDGTRKWYQWTDTITLDDEGRVAEIQAVGRDVTESRELGEAIRRSEERFRRAFEDAPIGMALLDDDHAIVSANQALLRFFDLRDHGALEGQSLPDLVVEPFPFGVERDSGALSREVRMRRADGSLRWAALSVSTLEAETDTRVQLMQVVDLEDRKRAEQQLEHEALHDPLTQLPNRTLLLDRLGLALQRRNRESGEVALLFGDLDQFKLVNDSFGHEVGDRLLLLVTRRLAAALRSHDTLARFGGDEFVILAEGLESVDATEEFARRIAASLGPPLNLGVAEVSVGISIGIALAGPDTTPSELIRRADTAMYDAKDGPHPRIAFYDRSVERRLAGRLSLRTRLDRAVDNNEFVPVYQPILDRDGAAIGTEALLRWDHGDGRLLEPDQFLAMAQDMGLIVPIGQQLLRRACAQAVTWSRMSGRPVQAWVNVGGREITQENFVDTVLATLSATGLPPPQLCLELTEWSVLEDVVAVAGRMRQLRETGVQFALDDFGTGYSALDFLRRFALDVIKIDGTFVRGLLDTDTNDHALVTAIAGLGSALGLKVVGEGVEHPEQARALRRLGVPLLQGRGLAAPARPASLSAWFCGDGAAEPAA